MLHIYRRHLKTCKFSSMRDTNCRYPIWVHGKVKGEAVRKALETLNWEAAKRIAREWEEMGREAGRMTVERACDRFYAYQEANGSKAETLGKYKLLHRRAEVLYQQHFDWVHAYSALKLSHP